MTSFDRRPPYTIPPECNPSTRAITHYLARIATLANTTDYCRAATITGSAHAVYIETEQRSTRRPNQTQKSLYITVSPTDQAPTTLHLTGRQAWSVTHLGNASEHNIALIGKCAQDEQLPDTLRAILDTAAHDEVDGQTMETHWPALHALLTSLRTPTVYHYTYAKKDAPVHIRASGLLPTPPSGIAYPPDITLSTSVQIGDTKYHRQIEQGRLTDSRTVRSPQCSPITSDIAACLRDKQKAEAACTFPLDAEHAASFARSLGTIVRNERV